MKCMEGRGKKTESRWECPGRRRCMQAERGMQGVECDVTNRVGGGSSTETAG